MESGDALANGGEDEIVRRSAKALAACLACDICTGLLIEPLTAAECMHCFCQECITAFVVAGQNTFCPVCQGEGVKTSFGPQPMRDHLRVDFMLTDLLKKVWLLQHGDGNTSHGLHSRQAGSHLYRVGASPRLIEKRMVRCRCRASWLRSQ